MNIPINLDTCSIDELTARCRECGFGEENTRLAIEFFYRKTKQSVIADQLCVEEKSVTMRKWRMKKRLTSTK